MRPVPTRLLTPALVLLLSAGLAACDELDATIGDAQDQIGDAREAVEDSVETLRWCAGAAKLGAAVAQRDVEAARAAADDLADKAPDELQDEVATIMAAIEEAEAAGTTEPLQTEPVGAAGQEVLSYSRERCTPGSNG